MSERIISPLGSENHFVKKSLWFTILDGNILSKTDVGDYSYDAAMRPHAVIGVTNQKGIIPSAALETTYGDLNKINMISNGTYETTFSYGPDLQRWLTVEKKNDTDYRTIHYAPGIERVTLGGVTRTFFYLGHGVIVMQQGSTYIPLLTVTDHQGTIAGLVDATGTWQFDANYDAWGRQTVAKNSIGFQRGYTGHEMLPEYGLINMRSARRDALLAKNGRLYDPLQGRFLSPDRSALCDAFVTTWRKNYVQQPDNSQSFNRYSYCLNNPLKYTDPDGEFLHLIFGAIIGGTVNWATHGCKFNAKGLGYFGVGALAGAVGAGIGAGISSALPVADQTAGGFAAGFLGTSSATTATSSFFSGALIGGGVGFSGGFVSGFGNTLVDGGSIGNAFKSGGIDAFLGGLSGTVVGGVVGGIDAVRDGRRFWDGATVTRTTLVDQNVPIVGQVGEMNCLPASAEAVDRSFGGNLTQQDIRNLPNLGGDPNLDWLHDDTVWREYSEWSGLQYGGERTITSVTPLRITEKMQNGYRVAINLNNSEIGHSVVMDRVVMKTITKISGKTSLRYLYYVMDPSSGGYIRRISPSDIVRAKNVFYIWR